MCLLVNVTAVGRLCESADCAMGRAAFSPKDWYSCVRAHPRAVEICFRLLALCIPRRRRSIATLLPCILLLRAVGLEEPRGSFFQFVSAYSFDSKVMFWTSSLLLLVSRHFFCALPLIRVRRIGQLGIRCLRRLARVLQFYSSIGRTRFTSFCSKQCVR